MNGQSSTYEAYELTEHLVRSTRVDQTFKIKVMQPMRRSDRSERFPVVYATDSDLFFGGFAGLSNTLQLLGEVPRFILVGIGYDDSRAAELLRTRDFYTHSIRSLYRDGIVELAHSPLIGGSHDVRTILETTDATDFLCFIREELMPWVEREYPIMSGENTYMGYSAGGGFGLYTLFTGTETFKRYILGSPATSYNGHNFGIDLARQFVESGRRMNVSVFMSVGDLEEFKKGFTQFDLVSGFYLLAKFLRQAAIPGLELTTRVFPGETHATAWTLAFSHGLKALFGPVDQVPYWPEYLKRG